MQPRKGSARTIRRAGAVLMAGSVLQLAAASLVDPQVFTSRDPLVKLQAIARNKAGWARQAVLFPVAFGLVTGAFGLISRILEGPERALAIIATALSALSTLLWLPLTMGRLRVRTEVDDMIREYQPGATVDLSGGGWWAFWPYTSATLTSIVAMASALMLSRLRRTTGATVLGLSVLTPVVLIPRTRDWPPLISYLFTGALALGMLVPEERPEW